MPKVSIVVPCYNEQNYLSICVEYLRKQTLEDIEILIVDDESSDSSCAIAREYEKKDKRIRLVRQKHGGLGAARNTGIKEAKGKYIYFLDCDDYIDEKAMEICYKKAEELNVELLFFDSDEFDEDGKKIGRKYYDFQMKQGEVLCGSELLKRETEAEMYYVPVWLYFYRRDIFEKYQLHFRPYVHEDNLFSSDVWLKVQKISYLNIPLHKRMVRAQSITTSAKTERHMEGAYEIVKDAITHMQKNKQDELVKPLKRWSLVNAGTCYETLKKVDLVTKKKYKKKVLKLITRYPQAVNVKLYLKFLFI